LDAFDFQLRTRIVYGDGALARLGELARELGARRVLLVTEALIRDEQSEARQAKAETKLKKASKRR